MLVTCYYMKKKKAISVNKKYINIYFIAKSINAIIHNK